jgi:RNA polymerase sigma-70 factor, ECF subfamily
MGTVAAGRAAAAVGGAAAAAAPRAELAALVPRLRRFARSLSRDEAAADDLVQAALERALLNLDRWRPGTRLDSWLCRILQNAWLDDRRRWAARGRWTVPIEEDMLVVDGGRLAEDRLLLSRVMEAVALLPREQRAVLDLVAFEGLTYREAADTLGAPIGTVMSRLARARLRLHTALGDGGAPAMRA